MASTMRGRAVPRGPICEYSGYAFDDVLAHTPAHASAIPASSFTIARITAKELSSMTPETFFATYIAARRPVVIEGLIDDPEFRVEEWSLHALTHNRKVADAQVHIEHRDTTTRTFGTGKKTPMSFQAFVKELESGREDLYMTTQPLAEDETGLHTQLFAQPLTAMKGKFPLRPRIMGNLIPSTINVWMGAAAHGSSSNLHHDFHDNLYLLLSGHKLFTIAPPSAAPCMYTHGRLSRIHPNGMINYCGNPTRGDGALPQAVLDALLQQDSASAEKGGKGKKAVGESAAVRRARKALEDALEFDASARGDSDLPSSDEDEDSLSPTASAGGGASKDLEAELVDELEHEEAVPKFIKAAAPGKRGRPSVGKPSCEADEMWAALEAEAAKLRNSSVGVKSARKAEQLPAKSAKTAATLVKSSEADEMWAALSAEAASLGLKTGSSSGQEQPDEDGASIPNHFSKIDLPRLRAAMATKASDRKRARATVSPDAFGTVQQHPEVASKFPEFAKVPLAVCEVRAGEMLYLPAGWFHEVVSFSDGASSSSAAGTGIHTALNYWFNSPTQSSFEMPYEDAYWNQIYDRMAK